MQAVVMAFDYRIHNVNKRGKGIRDCSLFIEGFGIKEKWIGSPNVWPNKPNGLYKPEVP